MKNFCAYFFLLLLFSCETTEIDHKEKTFFPTKQISLDNTNSYYYSFLSQVIDNNNIIRRINKISKQGIEIYTINSNHKQSSYLNDEEIRELKRPRGFYYLNKDSIFYFGVNKLIITDIGHTIKHNVFLNKTDEYQPLILTNLSPPFILKNTIYFTQIIDLPPGKTFNQKNRILGYNYKKDSIFELNNTHLPSIYNEQCYITPDYEISYAMVNKDTLIINYPIDDNLYIYSIKEQKVIGKKNVKSRFKKAKVKGVDCDKKWDTKVYWKHHYNSYIYTSIIYDKYKNIYYRILKLPKKDYDMNAKYNSLNIPFVITVLDKDLNIIAESKILNEKNKYIIFDYYVNSEGLWISCNNPDNPEYNEDKLRFELFNLSSK